MLRRSPLTTIALLVVGLAAPFAARGAAQRTFVASTGVDSNPCSIGAPCRSFAQAASQTLAKGEIVVIDSAGYGPVLITQSLSIIAPAGVYAGVTVFSGIGIEINGAGIDVSIRGLSVNGQGGATGIGIVDAASVALERIDVSAMATFGITIVADAFVSIADAHVWNNTVNGIQLVPALSGNAKVRLTRVRVENNGQHGIFLDNSSQLTVRDSSFSRNGGSGIKFWPDGSEFVFATIDNCTIAENGIAGIETVGGGSGTVTLSGNTIFGHANASYAAVYLAATFVEVKTRTNNSIVSNTIAVAGGGSLVALPPM